MIARPPSPRRSPLNVVCALTALVALAACSRTPPPQPPIITATPETIPIRSAHPTDAKPRPKIELGEPPRLPEEAQ